MKIGVYLHKEFSQAFRDRVGLIIAFVVPALIVWVFSLLNLADRTFGGDFRETDPTALVLTLAVWLSALTMASTAIHRERAVGTLQRLSVTPFASSLMVFAKAVVFLVVGTMQALIVWFGARILLPTEFAEAPIATGWLPLAGLALLGIAVGVFISSFLVSSTQLANTVTFLTLASMTLSGFLKPLDDLATLGAIAKQTPFTLGYRGTRAALEGGAEATLLLIMVVEALLLLAVAGLITRLMAKRQVAD